MKDGWKFTAAGIWLLASTAAGAQTEQEGSAVARDVVVTAAKSGSVELNDSASATGLDLSIRETPQSVSVIDRQRIEDFALTSVNDLLDQAVGVTVNRNETDRTTYYARGFPITSQQVDGIGLPLLGARDGDLDTILYERVDVVRGANAIMTGVGNPSATINYLRKRPATDLRASASAYLGSFNMWRAEGDLSAPLAADGSLRIRAIGAHEERGSWLDYNEVNRDVMAGLLAWDVTPALTATIGYSRQSNRARGVLWGALPLVYGDGSRIPYPRSASTAAPWTFVNTLNESSFGELAYRIGGDWSLRGVVTYNRQRTDSRRLYASGVPDAETGIGIVGSSGLYPVRNRQYLLDGYASGGVDLFGRRHQISIGISTGWLREAEYEAFSDAVIDYGDIRDLARFVPPQPVYPSIEQRGRERDRLTRVYAAIHLDLTDRLKGVVGASAVWLEASGNSYGTDLARDDGRFSPYAGLLFDLSDHLTVYGSYTDIYSPQNQVDVENRRLAPAKGTNVEGGIKGSWLADRLYASAAVFRSRQQGLASFVCTFGTEGCADGPPLLDYYEGVDTTATGFEAEVSGRVDGHWLLSGGFTHLRIRDDAGGQAQTFVPRDTLKIAATYQIPDWRDLKLGAQFRYQSTVRSSDDTGSGIPIRQHAYGLLDLFGEVRLAERVHASVNVRNVFDRRYLNSLEWGQAYYAAPRNVLGTIHVSY